MSIRNFWFGEHRWNKRWSRFVLTLDFDLKFWSLGGVLDLTSRPYVLGVGFGPLAVAFDIYPKTTNRTHKQSPLTDVENYSSLQDYYHKYEEPSE